MNELGPDARSLLEAARDGDEPDAGQRVRVRARVASRVIAASCAAGGATAVSPSATAAGATGAGAIGGTTASSAGVATKALVSLALLSGTAVGTAEYLRSRTPVSAHPSYSAPSSAPAAQATPRLPPVFAARELPMAIPTASPSATSSPVPDPAGASPVIARHGPAAAAEVEAEVQILRDAHAALQAGDPAGALALLDVHARRFPAGALAEEREATRPAALCVLGRTADARQAAAQFLRSFPDSLHAARVRKVCDTKQRETF